MWAAFNTCALQIATSAKTRVLIDILLGKRLDQIVELHVGDRQHRRQVELGIVKPGQQMDIVWLRCGKTEPQFAGPFRISRSHERSGFLAPHLNDADAVLAGPQRFHDAIDVVTRQTENHFDLPVDQSFDQDVGCNLARLIAVFL